MVTYIKPCRRGHLPKYSRTAPSGRRVCRLCERAARNRYYNTHPERKPINALNDRRLRFKKRQDLLGIVGGKCIKCNNSDWRVLQIDHVKGGGTKEIQELTIHQRYKRIREYPELYQLLCGNCNAIKKIENGEDTHKYPI